jgi:putative SOS response-associated peptidase YedK
MCNRFTMTFSEEDLRQFLDLPEIDSAIKLPRYNVAPSQTVPVLRRNAVQALELVPMRWGLVPNWAGDGSLASTGFKNARWETAGDKPAFCEAANLRRCAIPADGFFEWSTAGKKKQPHWFRWNGGQPFLFAGLWEPGSPETVAILTQNANDDVRLYNDRMPAFLSFVVLDDWLDGTKDWNGVRNLVPECPAGILAQKPVNPRMNSSRGEENVAWLEEYCDTLFG